MCAVSVGDSLQDPATLIKFESGSHLICLGTHNVLGRCPPWLISLSDAVATQKAPVHPDK